MYSSVNLHKNVLNTTAYASKLLQTILYFIYWSFAAHGAEPSYNDMDIWNISNCPVE